MRETVFESLPFYPMNEEYSPRYEDGAYPTENVAELTTQQGGAAKIGFITSNGTQHPVDSEVIVSPQSY